MTGYTRQSIADIIPGADVNAEPLNKEFDALQDAFHGVTGHPHDGGSGNGPKINLVNSVSGKLTTTNIADDAITTAQLEDGAVTEDKIANGAVTTDKIEFDAVTLTEIENPVLKSIGGLTTVPADKYLYTTGTDTFTEGDITSFGRSLIDDADATAARTTLSAQAQNANLSSIAGLTLSSGDFIYATGAATVSTTTSSASGRNLLAQTGMANTIPYYTSSTAVDKTIITSFGRGLIDDPDAATARVSLGLIIGTDVQAQDAGLQSIANLTTSADRMLYTTGSDTYATTSVPSYSRQLLSMTNFSSWRYLLGDFANRITTKSANYTVQSNESGAVFLVDASGGNITITLPTTLPEEDGTFLVEVRKVDNTFNTVTLARGTENIDGVAENKILRLPGQTVTLANRYALGSWYTVCESGTSYYNIASQYIRHSSGIQEAWGRATISFSAANGSVAVNFPANFVLDNSLAVFTVLIRDGDTATTSNFENHAGNYSENGFTLYARNNGGSGAQDRVFTWRAIGRWF